MGIYTSATADVALLVEHFTRTGVARMEPPRAESQNPCKAAIRGDSGGRCRTQAPDTACPKVAQRGYHARRGLAKRQVKPSPGTILGVRIAAVLVVTLIVSTGAYAAESDVLIEVAPRVVPLGEPVTLSGKFSQALLQMAI